MPRKVLLIAEDDELALARLVEALGDEFTVYGVANGQDAMSLLEKRNDIVLAILDNNLPAVNGIDILSALRRGERRIPAILMSGLMSRALAEEAYAQGAAMVLPKPLDLGSLRAQVREFLGELENERENPWPHHFARAAERCLPVPGPGGEDAED